MRPNVTALIRAEVGARWQLSIDEPRIRLGLDSSADFVRGLLTLTRTDQHILVEGSLESSIPTECVRCLDIFQQLLRLQLEEQFALAAGPSVTDPPYLVDANGTIDLTLPIREQIVLSVPIQPICRPDCKGLCIQCGKNLNEGPCECSDDSVDPRLASLKTLL